MRCVKWTFQKLNSSNHSVFLFLNSHHKDYASSSVLRRNKLQPPIHITKLSVLVWRSHVAFEIFADENKHYQVSNCFLVSHHVSSASELCFESVQNFAFILALSAPQRYLLHPLIHQRSVDLVCRVQMGHVVFKQA